MLVIWIIISPIIFSKYNFTSNSNINNLYPLAATVTDINHNIVTVTDNNDFMWQFIGAEDWYIGDIAIMIMNDQNTEIITDDTIIKVQYQNGI